MAFPTIIALVLGLLLGACAGGPPQVLERAAQAPTASIVDSPPEGRWTYRIGPGDLLRVNVFGHPELSSAMYRNGVPGTPVGGQGRIQLPLLGEIEVAGRTPSEVRVRVEEALKRYLRQPSVDVAVVEYGAHRVFVFGSVPEPGAYVLERPTTVLEAIGLAGGFDSAANREQVAWVRGGVAEANMHLVDASEIDAQLLAQVCSGDLVFVGRRGWADVAEAARDILPLLQGLALPLSLGLQAATLEKIN